MRLQGSHQEKSAAGEAEHPSWVSAREEMVALLRGYYEIRNERVLSAMGRVRRHRFIPGAYLRPTEAYGDYPCPIGHGQTISQPYIVAYMTECLCIAPGSRVLEIGAGSGYQAAVFAECGAVVYTVEVIPELARHAEAALRAEGYADRVHVRTGDGYSGWAEHAPYDAILAACAPDDVPPVLVEQLGDGGRMILPVDTSGFQRLVVLEKRGGRVRTREDIPVRFVPMIHDRPT